MKTTVTAALLMALLASGHPASAQAPQDYVDRAVEAFGAGRDAEALKAFDDLTVLIPEVAPELWQRGIVLFNAGRYRECAEQFRAFHDVSPNDVEDAVWHYLCVATDRSPAVARAGLLRPGPDPRVMRPEIYALYSGRITPAALLESTQNLPIALFYAHLYTGLYLDANGETEAALAHLREAASDRYLGYGGFMNVTARVYAETLRTRLAAAP
jgi:lipoprotein NlpI